MHEKHMFSNGQALATLDSTGVKSTDIWDLETTAGAVTIQTDLMLYGWINFIILSTTNATGDGLTVQLRTSDSTNLSTTPQYLGAIIIMKAEIVAGNKFSFGVCKHKLKRYVGMWYLTTTDLTGATGVDCFFSESPITSPSDVGLQKRPNTSFA